MVEAGAGRNAKNQRPAGVSVEASAALATRSVSAWKNRLKFAAAAKIDRLGDVVRRRVVAGVVPAPEPRLGIAAGIIAEHETDRGDTGSEEGRCIGAADHATLGLQIGAHFDPHRAGDGIAQQRRTTGAAS
jgi:hypothetical protein